MHRLPLFFSSKALIVCHRKTIYTGQNDLYKVSRIKREYLRLHVNIFNFTSAKKDDFGFLYYAQERYKNMYIE